MNYKITKINIKGNKVDLYYELNEEENVLEVLLKTYLSFPFSSFTEVDESKWKEMLKEENKNRIYDYAISIIKRGDISKFSLKQKLNKKYPRNSLIITDVIKKLEEFNYLNDDELLKHEIIKGINSFKGLRRIKYELSLKGFKEYQINEFINEELIELEQDKALLLGQKQMRLCSKLEFKKMRDKVYYKLNYAGYSSELIQEVMYKLNLIKEN